ncbi:unnamed protein product [Prorocentrum cordatum]|uniref:Uncharacterized protein n=1 Tax=Prorocentrum cordatum TaxID=2364126 RepID=A0ABN9R0D8_9DINO|nr:unnamed protein product [Polarella glacialis]
MHLVGAGVPKDVAQARALFRAAADAGDPEAQFNLALLHSAAHAEGDDVYRQEALAVLYLYAASTAGHGGALMAMGYRHQPRLRGASGVLHRGAQLSGHIDVAMRVVNIYSAGMPQAVELVRINVRQEERKVVSSAEMQLFIQMAASGDVAVAYAIGKRWLLGIEGFRQDYDKARQYLTMAATADHPAAQGLLGYMYCLGLGIPQNLDTAYGYFLSASLRGDELGHNGLGYLYFRGTSVHARNYKLAFRHFNESADKGSSDGMFNLASMYLTGTGTTQSFQRAVLHYTQALDRGHTPAAYSLAIMYLNGIGAPVNCDIAAKLLRTVCERGSWVADKLADATALSEKSPDRAALLYLKLAETGHEVAQMNVAHMFDVGQSSLLFPGDAPTEDASTAEATRQHGRILAQRYYEMSAEQGSPSSELRLGDYAFYGWGMSASFQDGEDDADDGAGNSEPSPSPEVKIRPQAVDYEASLARYRRTAETTVTGLWMQSFVARGYFNLAFMHQFGLGVPQDVHLARAHYHKSREVDPATTTAPVALVLPLLGLHGLLLRVPAPRALLERLLLDVRVHALGLHLVVAAVLIAARARFSASRRPPPRARAPRGTVQAPAGQPGGAPGRLEL